MGRRGPTANSSAELERGQRRCGAKSTADGARKSARMCSVSFMCRREGRFPVNRELETTLPPRPSTTSPGYTVHFRPRSPPRNFFFLEDDTRWSLRLCVPPPRTQRPATPWKCSAWRRKRSNAEVLFERRRGTVTPTPVSAIPFSARRR